ncbi:MAG: DUF4249 family protein [Crocinitomicaceae bacterium]
MNYIKIIIIAIVTLGFFSCEEVIELPLNNANQKIVVEGFTSNIEGRNFIKLTKTSNVYTTNNFETVSNAEVIITDSDGINYVFTEDPEDLGVYVLPGYKVEPNKTYTLKVTSGDEVITGVSQSSFEPNLDILLAGKKGQVQEFLPEDLQDGLSFFPDDLRLVFYLFSDPEPVGDNYRIIAYVNGEREDDMYIANDVLSSGQPIGGVLFGTDVDSTDTVHIELLTMDNANYDYFFSLVNNTSTGPFAATPSNPVSNLTDNALGYFGAYLMDTVTTVAF